MHVLSTVILVNMHSFTYSSLKAITEQRSEECSLHLVTVFAILCTYAHCAWDSQFSDFIFIITFIYKQFIQYTPKITPSCTNKSSINMTAKLIDHKLHCCEKCKF